MGTVTIHETRFTEEEITLRDEDGIAYDTVDPPYDDEHTSTTVYDELTAREAADLIRRHGLTFAASGTLWAANPDRSYISNYATGERVETTAHPSGFPTRVLDAIIAVVDRT